MIIHIEDKNREGYYRCNHAVGLGNPKKLTKQWKKVTCENCLKRYKNEN